MSKFSVVCTKCGKGLELNAEGRCRREKKECPEGTRENHESGFFGGPVCIPHECRSWRDGQCIRDTYECSTDELRGMCHGHMCYHVEIQELVNEEHRILSMPDMGMPEATSESSPTPAATPVSTDTATPTVDPATVTATPTATATDNWRVEYHKVEKCMECRDDWVNDARSDTGCKPKEWTECSTDEYRLKNCEKCADYGVYVACEECEEGAS